MNVTTYHRRLFALPCIVGHHMGMACRCEEIHHVGDAEERDDFAVVGLCVEHHRGATGVHGLHRRAFHARYKLTDVQMLAIARRLYAKEYGA
jgi:hypothetical protein